jgi:Spy/CpxP family protein refolding chaperone
MRTAAAAAFSLLVALAAAEPAGAQNPARRPREEAFKMVEAYVVSNLQESLGLTDEQFAKLLPHVKRLQRDRRELAQRRGRALAEMRRVLASGTVTEARVAELLKEVKAVEAEQPEVVRKDMEAIDAVLTPVQQGKFRLLEGEVERRIRALMNDLRPNRNPARNRQPPPSDEQDP